MARMMHVLRRAYFPSLIRQQVIVRSHRQKDDYGHRQYEPAQFDAENYCQSSTESPNDAPSESATVPTITRAATKLRVMTSMMIKMRQSEAIPAIKRSYFAPSFL